MRFWRGCFATDSTEKTSGLEPFIHKPDRRGRKPTPWRAVLNAIFYVLRNGGTASARIGNSVRASWIVNPSKSPIKPGRAAVGGWGVGTAAAAEDSVGHRAAVGRESVCRAVHALECGTHAGLMDEMAAVALRPRTAHRSQGSIYPHDDAPSRLHKMNSKTRSQTSFWVRFRPTRRHLRPDGSLPVSLDQFQTAWRRVA